MSDFLNSILETRERTAMNEVRNFLQYLFIPTMHEIFKKAAPEKYKKWGGNCCRQTAVFGCYILSKMLPDFEWYAWEADFDDILDGKPQRYQHAWIYGKSKAKKYLIDLARSHKETLFIEVQGNRYPKDHPDYIHMKELSRSRINWEELLRETDSEWYTGRPSIDVVKDIIKEIQNKNKKGANA